MIELTPFTDRVERRDVVAEIPHERQDEATEGRIDVQVQALAPGEVGERLDGVEGPEVAARGGADEADGARRDRLLDVLDPRQVGLGVDVDLDELDLHELRAEAEREVHRDRRDDLRRVLLAIVAREPHRCEVRFGAAGGDEPGGIGLAEQRRHHADGLALHRHRALLGVGPFDEEPPGRDGLDAAADRGRDARVRDREVLLDVVRIPREPRFDLGEDLVLRPAMLREVGPRDRRDVGVVGGQVEFGGRHD
jgi:hypothetical protein